MSEMIYGIHAVQALLERAPERFQEVFILKAVRISALCR
ncbi:23S rRNA (guanosine-2'-O-)-methyltransferase [Klebsiella michiganensis]|nr:23S rRNA (guanosine-2'-O-)-methyltransferase [Klebsiella michiganensis]